MNAEIDGRLPLHYASDYGQLEVIRYLCSKVSWLVLQDREHQTSDDELWFQGANLNAADKHGISPLLAAVWEGHTSCVKFLLEKVSKGHWDDDPKLNSLLSGSSQRWENSWWFLLCGRSRESGYQSPASKLVDSRYFERNKTMICDILVE